MSDEEKENDFFGSDFNSSKYFKNNKVSVGPANLSTYFTDGSDAYANQNKLFISFHHVPSGKSVFFKAFITAFNEAYNCDWSSESVYGRADPIYMFKQTQRKITLAFKIPASSTSEAYENLTKVQSLTQFLYPSYTSTTNATTISQSPLIRIKVMNLLSNRADVMHQDNTSFDAHLDNYTKRQSWSSNEGLLGVVENLAVGHNLEGDDGAFVVGSNAILPKFLDINLSFAPIHEEPLGWDSFGKFSSDLFPYGADSATVRDLTEEAINSNTYEALKAAIEAGESGGDYREATEAALAEQEARYSGMGGMRRLKKDLKSGDEAARAYAQEQMEAGAYSDRQSDKIQDAYDEGIE